MRTAVWVALLALLFAGAAAAQTGAITGIVVDEVGDPIEGARVAVMTGMGGGGGGGGGGGMGGCVYVYTAADGTFLLEEIPVGVVDVRVQKSGFYCTHIDDVEILEGEITDLGTIVLHGKFPRITLPPGF